VVSEMISAIGAGRRWKAGLLLRPLWIIALLLPCACVINTDPYWIFGDERTVVSVRDSAGTHARWYSQVLGPDTVNVMIVVRRARNIARQLDTNSLMIDLIVGQKRLAERISFNPAALGVEVNGAHLRLTKSRDRRCGRFGCSYLTTFWLEAAECLRTPTVTTEPWCVIDFDGVLALDTVPLDIGTRYGWLPDHSAATSEWRR
jgi:hypothetical protein